ncbi:MAG: hypothetical protein NTV68_10610 [Methanomicrobiales archaeon]|nr:hypothetical protein [Methanomicrobiales archaeon]
MANYKIKSLNVMSVAKIGAILGLIFGLIEGIIMALVVGSMGVIAKNLIPMAGLGAGLILVFAIIFGLIGGFIGGAIWAFIYNVAAGFVGPIEMDLEV